jgi:hypothetical protein
MVYFGKEAEGDEMSAINTARKVNLEVPSSSEWKSTLRLASRGARNFGR